MSDLYRFLTGDDNSDFCHKVSEALSKGWELYGSPTYTFDAAENKLRCGQAVIKKSRGPLIKSDEAWRSINYDQNQFGPLF